MAKFNIHRPLIVNLSNRNKKIFKKILILHIQFKVILSRQMVKLNMLKN